VKLSVPFATVVTITLGCSALGCSASVGAPSASTPGAGEPTEAVEGAAGDPFAEPPSLGPARFWVLGPFPLEEGPNGSRVGIDRDFLETLGGESQAVVTAETTMVWGGQKLGALVLRADSAGVVDFASAFSGPTYRQLA
jgi:hypothetical protein